ncbi:MAG: Tim44 domain-containing protein [Nitrospiraceae bacterium]|nr:Tim44 domain-containing protein [Nitrospiraceae bacterium]
MKKIFLTIIALTMLTACGSEVKKVTEESETAKEVFAVAETIKDAYLKRDLSTIEKNATKEGYREILGAIKHFDTAELTFENKWVDIDKSSVTLRVAWSGKWTLRKQEIEERGTAIFIFEPGSLKLRKILRVNPFRQPE